MKGILLSFFFLTLLLSFNTIAQLSSQRGLLSVKNYTNQLHRSLNNIGAIIQDKRGVMYLGTSSGVVEFDGKNFRVIPMPNNSIVRSLDIDEKGKIFVGAQGEAGYLEPDENGKMIFKSIIDKFPDKSSIGDIWNTSVFKDKVIFLSSHTGFIYTFKDEKVSSFHCKVGFIFGHKVRNKFYAPEHGGIIWEVNEDNTVTEFNHDDMPWKAILIMLPYSDNKTLFVGTPDIFHVNDNKSYQPLNPETANVLINSTLNRGLLLRNGLFVFATHLNGVIIVNKQGQIVHQLNKTNGLQNNVIRSLYEDAYGNLWIGTESGLDMVELDSPFTMYNELLGIQGAALNTVVINNRIYVATNLGVFVKNMNFNHIGQPGKFTPVEGTIGEVRNLSVIDEQLICGHHEGAYFLNGVNSNKVSSKLGAWLFRKLESDPQYMIEGHYFGLLRYNKINDEYTNPVEIKNFQESSRFFEEDEDGYIWVSHEYKGVWKLTLNKEKDEVINLEYYGEQQGLPSIYSNRVYKIKNKIHMTTSKGVYVYDKQKNKFTPDDIFSKLIGRRYVKGVYEDKYGNIWYLAEDTIRPKGDRVIEPGVIRKDKNGDYFAETIIFNKLHELEIERIDPVDSHNVFFNSLKGVIHYDPGIEKNVLKDYSTLIVRVKNGNENPSLISGGYYPSDSTYTTIQSKPDIYDYKSNSLHFAAACNYYEDIEKIRYRFYLKGYDSKPTEWLPVSTKEYTNLPEGTYSFYVWSKNIYGKVGEQAVYHFIISPPWYRAPLAYIAYFLILIFFVVASAYFYGKQLRRKNQNLEKIIIERTKEIQTQRDELEVQKDEVAEKNKELYQLNVEKNKLIGMVAHDLKSPLGQIKAIASIIKSDSENLNNDQKDLIEKIFEVSSRLSKLISSILNVNAIEAGKINLNLQKQNLAPIINDLNNNYKISADEKNIKLYFSSDVLNDVCLIDKDFFILIMENLISNALKFCTVGKCVWITLTNLEDKIRITVKDEGPGIKETEMNKLFKSFQKLSSRPTGGENSTGLGLSIVKRYVEAMNGKVWCESVEGAGASFIVEFSTVAKS